jgi:hypothetical protein
MRFTDFLKATVLACGAAATALAAVTVAGASQTVDDVVVIAGIVWWLVAAIVGGWLGRRRGVSQAIGGLLAGARSTNSLPEVRPGRMLLNRLWPLLLATVAAGALAFLYPQVPMIACGFTVMAALAWRRQEAAVTAIEERDGVRFYIERTSPLKPIKLVRTPWFRAVMHEVSAAEPRAGVP